VQFCENIRNCCLQTNSGKSSAVGMFELQIRHFQNLHGLLQTGDCCDLPAGGGGQLCSARDQCDTFFQACLKEYQARVAATGACTFGSGATGILGGNSQTLHHRGHDGGGGGGGGGEDGANGHIVIPFKYAWPVSAGAVMVPAVVTKGTG
uniref:Notch ligand N-terminal domain-containing protein n=1 Tax=Salarias fasciatus TaxID=181472 RepID=A0A672F584_SALFA